MIEKENMEGSVHHCFDWMLRCGQMKSVFTGRSVIGLPLTTIFILINLSTN